MKKFILPVAVVAMLAFSSCGTSVCDCVKMGENAMKELAEAKGDEAKMKSIQEKYEAKAKACEKLAEGKSKEEQEKMMEEAKNCK